MRYFICGLVLLEFLFGGATTLKAEDVPTTQPTNDRRAREEAFFRKNILDAYETVGHRNPKWDDNARKVLELAVKRWMTPVADPDGDWEIVNIGTKAAKAGCDDLAVLYHLARARSTLRIPPDKDLNGRIIEAASDSEYAPFLKVYAFTRSAPRVGELAQGDDATLLAKSLRKAALDNLPTMVAETDLSRDKIVDICTDLTYTGVRLDGDRKPSIDEIYDIIENAEPNSPTADLFKAAAYLKYAWDARGNGFANTVTQNGWQLFNDRIDVARESCEAALAKDPHFAAASAKMINVELGEDVDRAEMEKYFQRAIADDPDNFEAYSQKLYYLTPKWHGTPEDQLIFGRECLATKRWDARIPFLLLQSHHNIVESRFRELCATAKTAAERQKASNQALSELYRAAPPLWNDVQELYEGYFAHKPQAVADRMQYSELALLTGKVDIAAAQLDILDADKDPIFKDFILRYAPHLPVAAALRDRGLNRQAMGDLKGGLDDLRHFCKALPAAHPHQWYGHLWVWMVQTQLGEKAQANQDLQAFLKTHPATGPNEWPGKIAAYFLDQLSEEDFLAAAQTSAEASRQGNLCEAWYYAGKKRLIVGDKEAAKTYFAQCVGTKKSDFSEYHTAEKELKTLDDEK